MAKMVEYTVARGHLGDKITDDGIEQHFFEEGEPRLADPMIVAALVKSGVLVDPNAKAEEPAPADKAEPAAPSNTASGAAPANKAEGAAPRNRAVSGLRNKG
jgi:hypothetical protein